MQYNTEHKKIWILSLVKAYKLQIHDPQPTSYQTSPRTDEETIIEVQSGGVKK